MLLLLPKRLIAAFLGLTAQPRYCCSPMAEGGLSSISNLGRGEQSLKSTQQYSKAAFKK